MIMTVLRHLRDLAMSAASLFKRGFIQTCCVDRAC